MRLSTMYNLLKNFKLDDSDLCTWTVGGYTFNASDVLRDVYLFLTEAHTLEKIAEFAPIDIANREPSARNLQTVKFRCIGDVGNSFYSEFTHSIIFRFGRTRNTEVIQHTALHEFLHPYTELECPTNDERNPILVNKLAHCRVFKRGLLLADFMYGLLSEEDFTELTPLIDSYEPEDPYKFEWSYRYDKLKTTTRHQFQIEEKKKEKKRGATLKGRISRALRFGGINFSIARVVAEPCFIEFDLSLDLSKPTAEKQSLYDTNIETIIAQYPNLFAATTKQNIDKNRYKITNYYTGDGEKTFRIKEALDIANTYEPWFLMYSDEYMNNAPKMTKRNKLEIDFKFEFIKESSPLTDIERKRNPSNMNYIPTENYGWKNCLIEDFNKKIESQIQNGEIFEYIILNKGRSVLSFDGFFLSVNHREIAFEIDDESMCFMPSLKTDAFEIPLDAFEDKYTFKTSEIASVVEEFMYLEMSEKTDEYAQVCVFDTDMLFENLLTLIRNESEIIHQKESGVLAQTSQFSSQTDYETWRSDVSLSPTEVIDPSIKYAFSDVDTFIKGIIQFLLPTEEYTRIGFAKRNLIKGLRQAFLSENSIDFETLALYIKKGLPFLNAYAKAETQKFEDWIFLYFDGRKLSVFKGSRFSKEGTIDLNEIESEMHEGVKATLFSINYMDFGSTNLPRANFRGYSENIAIRDLLMYPVASFKDGLKFNLFEIPKEIYATEIISNLETKSNVLLKSVIKKGAQLFAVDVDGEIQYLYLNALGDSRVVNSVYAWWLLAL